MNTQTSTYRALAQQVMDWCDQLAAITAEPGKISRFYLTPEHQRGNELVAQWMQAAGMKTWVDAAGNLCGRYAAAAQQANAKTLLLASHLDSIPNAGAYDGILGVLLAIAAVQQLNEQQLRLPFAIEVVGFGDEEGTRFGSTLLGSRALAGTWEPHWWSLKDKDGYSLSEAFQHFNLAPANVAEAARNAEDILAYIEVHIEQGPVLEQQNLALGIVTAIAGARRFKVELTGYAGHAGTVPMAMRRDALAAAAEAVLLVESIAAQYAVVATVGQISCAPGAVNVIPGSASFSIDIRSGDDAQRDLALAAIQQQTDAAFSRRHITAHWQQIHNAPAVACADWLQQLQAQVLGAMQLPAYQLMSGAGHDAMAVADIADVAMYFVRCKGGVSHHPDESVTTFDVALALEALLRTITALAPANTATQ